MYEEIERHVLEVSQSESIPPMLISILDTEEQDIEAIKELTRKHNEQLKECKENLQFLKGDTSGSDYDKFLDKKDKLQLKEDIEFHKKALNTKTFCLTMTFSPLGGDQITLESTEEELTLLQLNAVLTATQELFSRFTPETAIPLDRIITTIEQSAGLSHFYTRKTQFRKEWEACLANPREVNRLGILPNTKTALWPEPLPEGTAPGGPDEVTPLLADPEDEERPSRCCFM